MGVPWKKNLGVALRRDQSHPPSPSPWPTEDRGTFTWGPKIRERMKWVYTERKADE